MICCCHTDRVVFPEPRAETADHGETPESFTEEVTRVPGKKRCCVDKLNIFLFTVFWIFALACLVFSIYFSDIDRLARGYDFCGNICGKKNEAVKNISCSGLDHTQHPYVLTRLLRAEPSNVEFAICVEKCPDDHDEFFWRCKSKTAQMSIHVFLHLYYDMTYLLVCLSITLFLSIIFMFMAFLIPERFPIVVLVITGILMFAVSVAQLVMMGIGEGFKNSNKRAIYRWPYYGFLCGVVAIIAITTSCVIFKIPSVFVETTRLWKKLPQLFIIFVLTTVFFVGALISCLYLLILTSTSGILVFDKGMHLPHGLPPLLIYDYKPQRFKLPNFICICIGTFMLPMLIKYCGNFMFAGIVSKWFFSRERGSLRSPACETFYHLTRFHMGTVCFCPLKGWGFRIKHVVCDTCCFCSKERERLFVSMSSKNVGK